MLRIILTKRNRNRLSCGTHTLAEVLRNQGFKLHAPRAGRAPTDQDRAPWDADRERGGMGTGCPEHIPQPALVPYVADGVLDPKTGLPVLWSALKVQ